ncbi:Cof-type HAD-IIB family hydrolase [uncultured Microbacterium sp.]|uniref:Cof-type HAD-IIB family hydrolase n=3 Tax=Microbacterium TaxID=33882 RepID=UPI0032B0F61C
MTDDSPHGSPDLPVDPDALAGRASEIRLIAADMDGTLLDGQGAVPPALWPMLDRLRDAGIAFAPASGRQHATLRREFGAHGDDLVFIAENGTFVTRGDEELSSDTMDRAFVDSLIAEIRGFRHDVGVVLCGKASAYIERTDAAFRDQAEKYYARLADVADLTAVDDDILKIAVFDVEDGEKNTAPALERHRLTHQVVVSGHHWVDVMNQGVSKGKALRAIQNLLDVTPEQTAVFGDYLNDLDMMDAADFSFAMANAHPDVAAAARYRAPSNVDHGVIQVLERLLG